MNYIITILQKPDSTINKFNYEIKTISNDTTSTQQSKINNEGSTEIINKKTVAKPQKFTNQQKLILKPGTPEFVISNKKNDTLGYSTFKKNLKDTTLNQVLLSKKIQTITENKPVAKLTEKNNNSTTILIPKEEKNKFEAKHIIRTTSNDWILGVILLSLVIIAWIRLIYNKIIQQNYKAVVSLNMATKLFNERNSLTLKGLRLLYVVFIINISLYAYESLEYFNISIFPYHSFINYLLLVAIISGIFFLQSIILNILEYILLTGQIFSEYQYNVSLFNRMTGLLFIPIIITLPYIDNEYRLICIISGAIIFILVYILRIIRGLQISMRIRLSYLYIILYLCVLEIIPMLFVYKIFILKIK